MIESSNGYRLRPLQHSDEGFVYEALRDFPIYRMSLEQVRREMSNLLYLTDGFDVADRGQRGVCLVLELAGNPLGLRLSKFNRNGMWAEIALLAMHPDARGAGHQSAEGFMHGWWYFDQLNLNGCWFEAVDTAPVNGAASKWRGKREDTETSRPSVWDGQTLRRLQIRPKAYRELLAEHPTWSSVSIALS